MKTAQGYLLCCIERTGSSFLAQSLTSTGVAGRPREYFNPAEQEKPFMRNILGDANMVDGFEKILTAGTTENGVFGVKLHWAHLRFLGMSIEGRWNEWQRMAMYDMLKAQPIESLTSAAVERLLTPRFADLRDQATAYRWLQSALPGLQVVWLKRKNMVARAISHFRAKRTGIWGISMSDREAAALRRPEMELEEIHLLHRIGCFQESLWQLFFSQQTIDPLVVFYEDLVADHEHVVRGVIDFLHLDDGRIVIPATTSTKQADDSSVEWERRYREWLSKSAGESPLAAARG